MLLLSLCCVWELKLHLPGQPLKQGEGSVDLDCGCACLQVPSGVNYLRLTDVSKLQ